MAYGEWLFILLRLKFFDGNNNYFIKIHVVRILKLALLSFFILLLLITVISFFFPSYIRISRTINVKSSTDSVFQYVDDLEKWTEWNPAFMKLKPGQIEWLDSVDGRKTKMKVEKTFITLKQPHQDEVVAQIENSKRKIICGWKTFTYTISDSITILSYMDLQARWYPWEKFSILVFEKVYGLQMEQGLKNLKRILEKSHSSLY